jgi:protein gp37
MGTKTFISWTGSTWNCLRGCSRTIAKGAKTSGCGDPTGGGCYAERNAWRFAGEGLAYEGLVRMTPNGPRWTGKVLLVEEHLLDPIRWTDPRMIFTTSVSDPFHESLPFERIALIYGVMAATPHHVHQCLTKRAARRREFHAWVIAEAAACNGGVGMTPAAYCFALLQRYVNEDKSGVFSDHDRKRLASTKVLEPALAASWPLPNVWEGVSVEHQEAAAERVPELLLTPAAVRFLSVEPMIGPVDLLPWFDPSGACCGSVESCPIAWTMKCPSHAADSWRCTEDGGDPALDWVIIGAESGPGARGAEIDWYRNLVEQCGAAGVSVFLKQAIEAGDDDDDPTSGITFGEGSKRKGADES